MIKEELLKSGKLALKFMVINECEAKELYEDAPKNFKNKLEDVFGKEAFEKGVTSRIKTFRDARLELGVKWPSVSLDAYSQLKIIVKALNGGWSADWSNGCQPKHYPVFKFIPDFHFSNVEISSGFGSTSLYPRSLVLKKQRIG